MDRHRIALVGCGSAGLRHLDAYALPVMLEKYGLDLVAVCDADVPAAMAAAERFEAATGRTVAIEHSFADLLDGSIPLDAVDLAVPTNAHVPLGLSACQKGLHVLLEKPIALTIGSARALAEAAEQAGVVLAVAENYRRIPSNRAIKWQLDLAGGAVWSSSVVLVPEADLYIGELPRWYQDPTLIGSVAALEIGVHEADLMNFWFGPVQAVSAMTSAHVKPEDTIGFVARAKDGSTHSVSISAGTVRQAHRGGRLIATRDRLIQSDSWVAWSGDLRFGDTDVSSSAEITAEMLGSGVAGLDRLLPEGTYHPNQITGPHAGDVKAYGIATAIADFGQALATHAPPEVGADEAIRALAVSLAITESARSERWVDVDTFLAGAASDSRSEERWA